MPNRYDVTRKQVVLHTNNPPCGSVRELLASDEFARMVGLYCNQLKSHESPLLEPFRAWVGRADGWTKVVSLLRVLAAFPFDEARRTAPQLTEGLDDTDRESLLAFVEGLYTYWRSFDRYMVLHSEPGPSSFDQRPYRSFNATVEQFVHVVRAAYRDIGENISGDHPRIYRQVAAGCDAALIAVPREGVLPEAYRALLEPIPLIRQVWLAPPMIIDPPTNTRTGEFQRVAENPLSDMRLAHEEWLCFPAQVGPLVIFIYFHQRFMGLGCALANLFELATDAQVAHGPDAVYVYGAPSESLARFGDLPTVFFDDDPSGVLVAAVPGEDRFGYFGYLKKMTLTLHNIVMMKRGRMPYHGAMVRIVLKNEHAANVLIIGDTATGKSESLEALRILGDEHIRDMTIVADDMGSLEIDADGRLHGYGTETGAFIRLDDLQQGYVFTQVDRAVIMSPQKVNARVVVPVTTLEEVLRGYTVDFLLYANNYEMVTDEYPVLERMEDPEQSLRVFRRGAAMAKGTTTSTGLVHSYFANIFGPPQYRDLHDPLAEKVFRTAHATGVYVAQLRTQLGVAGRETEGPRLAAAALLEAIATRSGGTT